MLKSSTQKNIKRIPKLRFPDFSDTWEEEKFGKIFHFKTTNSFTRDDLSYENGDVKNIHYGDIHKKFKSHFDVKKENVPFVNNTLKLSRTILNNYCKEGDLILADASEDYADIGKCIEIVNTNNEKVISGLHTIHSSPNKKNFFILGFAGYLMKSKKVRLQIMKKAQGTKVLSISPTRLSEVSLIFPQSSLEQKKIKDVFCSVDELIESLNRQKEDLRLYKNEIIRKIFSYKIKFDNLSKWKEYPLENFIEEYIKKQKLNNKYPILSSSMDGISLQSDYFNHEVASKDNSGYKIVPRGYFTYRSMSDTGSFTFNLQNLVDAGVVSPAYPVFKAKDNINDIFLFYLLNNSKNFKDSLLSVKQGGTRFALGFSKFKKIKIKIPPLDEQKNIATYLISLDELIKLKDNQLKKVSDWKDGLIQELFV